MDETLNCELTIDEERKKAKITNLQSEDVEIDFLSDVDFTNLVSILTEKVDSLQQINITLSEEPTDDKVKLITDTIKEIFEKYNESITQNIEEDMF